MNVRIDFKRMAHARTQFEENLRQEHTQGVMKQGVVCVENICHTQK